MSEAEKNSEQRTVFRDFFQQAADECQKIVRFMDNTGNDYAFTTLSELAVAAEAQAGGYWSLTPHRIDGKRVFVIGVK